jgi:hypothetical protein
MNFYIKHRLYAIMLFLCSSIFAQANNDIEGIIFEKNKDGKKIGLPGANVYWLDTQVGTATDEHGKFSLKTSNKSSKLIISFIGYKSDTLTIDKSSNNPIEVVLQSSQNLAEVVIAKKALGSHISRAETIFTQKVTSEELCKAP